MSSFIKDCFSLYNKTFDENWLKSKSDPLIIIGEIDSFERKAFVLLSKAVISGEYLSSENYRDSLKRFKEGLCKQINNEDVPVCNKFTDLNNALKSCIELYDYFYTKIENKINNNEQNLLFIAPNGINKIDNKNFADFTTVIKLSIYDHSMSLKEDEIISLILIKEYLLGKIKSRSNNFIDIYSILLDKCIFLIQKVYYHSLNKTYIIDSTERPAINEKSYRNRLKKLIDNYNFIYDKGNASDSAIIVEKCKRSLIIDKVRLSDFILLMKYYKNDISSKKDIEALILSFEKYYTEKQKELIPKLKYSKNKFDLIALDSVRNYLYNSALSFNVKLDGYSFDMLKQEITKIKEQTTGIANYFPFLKGLEYLDISMSRQVMEKPYPKDTLKNEIDYFNTLIIEFEESVNKCKRISYYPFQLNINDCTMNDSKINIFIASSFCRPINYEELSSKIALYKYKYTMLCSQLSSQQYICKEIDNIEAVKKEMTDLKKEIESKEAKNIEKLGIFVAIITLLFSGVSMFNTSEIDVRRSTFNILSLGLVLCLFVVQLKIFNSMSKDWIIASFISLIILLIVLMWNLNTVLI